MDFNYLEAKAEVKPAERTELTLEVPRITE
jgi:hypothetical protein